MDFCARASEVLQVEIDGLQAVQSSIGQPFSDAIDAMKALGDRRSTAELLIETARNQTETRRRASTQNGMPMTDPKSTLRLAHKLATEVGWDEGAALSMA